MLRFEREVVAALVDPELGPSERAAVEQYVDESLQAMPEYLRAGVAAESLIFGAWATLLRKLGRGGVAERIAGMRTSSIDPVRQYVRLLHSLVLFAEHELAVA
jgi:hypothetical protein